MASQVEFLSSDGNRHLFAQIRLKLEDYRRLEIE